MTRRKSAAVIALAIALSGGCGSGATPTTAGSATSPAAHGRVPQDPSPGLVDGTGATSQSAGPGDRPVTAGGQRCLDPQSAVVRDAVAGLPPYQSGTESIQFRPTTGTSATLGACPSLMWVRADAAGGTASSPEWILFFDKQGYLGTAARKPTAYTDVDDSADATVAVVYRWLNPRDASAHPTGGPVTVRYKLIGRSVQADREVPPEAVGAHTIASTGPITPTASTTHCSTATPAVLQAVANKNWGNPHHPPLAVESIRCADDWAFARIPANDDYHQNSIALFRYDNGWKGVTFGSGFTCTDHGVPPSTAAAIGCA